MTSSVSISSNPFEQLVISDHRDVIKTAATNCGIFVPAKTAKIDGLIINQKRRVGPPQSPDTYWHPVDVWFRLSIRRQFKLKKKTNNFFIFLLLKMQY